MEPWPATAVHVEWGEVGARLAAERGDDVVVVDVLSFSTTLTIAIERGFDVYVYPRDEAPSAAERLGARLMDRFRDGELSLSPARVLGAADPGVPVVFTSLNGAACADAANPAPFLAFGCLRNRTAVAGLLDRRLRAGEAHRVTIVPAGERWLSVAPGVDGYRPSAEDWIGAGGIAAALVDAGHEASVEALAAAAAYRSGVDLRASVSARELVEAGFPADVDLALETGSPSVPVRIGNRRFGPGA